MGRLGCTIDGNLDDSNFSEPMPWIGIYVAAASAACALAMAMDAIHGFRYRKFWFPSKFFSLNATTLTLIGVATKLSVDLNTSMPHRRDQLAKLSSAVFICTVIGNFMPSLGTMETKEMLMNIMALGILVITAIVNICIQLGTGVIYVYQKEHVFVMFLMLLLLAILCSSALTVPTTKCYFDMNYSKKQKLAVKECSDKIGMCIDEKLKDDLMKYWVMAHTSSPQFVMGRLATITASGAFCLLGALTLAEAMLRSYLVSFKFCTGESDYKWSTTLVLVTQTTAVVVGTIAPALRWFTPVNFRCPKKAIKVRKPEFKMENYWIRRLIQWKECPLALRIGGRHGRKLAHNTKNRLLDFCIWIQTMIVWMSKLVRLISIFFVSWFLIFHHYWYKTLLKCNNILPNNDSEPDSQRGPNLDISHFVLHLEGDEELVDLMTENNYDAIGHWFRMGKKKQPKYLIQLLEKYTPTPKFEGVSQFDNKQVPSLDSEESPNCWALPVVTLTSIGIALSNVNHNSIKRLKKSVHEGLTYVRVIENNLDAEKHLINIRKAAEMVWVRVDLYHKWLAVDLRKMSLEEKSPKETLELLSDIAKNKSMEFRKKDINGYSRDTPSEVLAANSMYRICQTLLLDCESRNCGSSEILFERLSAMISDILGACLTNLSRVISMQCYRGPTEDREESVRYAVLLLGKTEEILKILNQKPLPSSDPNLVVHIDNWRLLSKEEDPMQSVSSSEDSDIASAHTSSNLYLKIV